MTTNRQQSIQRGWTLNPAGKPAGLMTADEVADLLQCRRDHIPGLIKAKLLVPLGRERKPNSRHVFAVVTMQANVASPDWLSEMVACNAAYDRERASKRAPRAAQRRCRSKTNPFGDAPDASPMPNQSSHAE